MILIQWAITVSVRIVGRLCQYIHTHYGREHDKVTPIFTQFKLTKLTIRFIEVYEGPIAADEINPTTRGAKFEDDKF